MEWFEPLIWTDYRVAIIFMVFVPIILLIWAFTEKIEAIQTLLIIYGKIASLLIIAFYLMMGANPLGYVSAFFARILIPITLWFWADINDEIEDLSDRPLKTALTGWRWGMTIYNIVGTIALIPFMGCIGNAAIKTAYCETWLKAPWFYKTLFHADSKPGTLAFFGLVGLMVYIFYLSYFLLVRLPKQGRTAMEI